METKFIKIISESQKAEVEAMAAELKKLSEKLAAFRLTEGDNRGLVEAASSYANMAANDLEELVLRAQPSRRRFAGR
jgi:hypothetical protein